MKPRISYFKDMFPTDGQDSLRRTRQWTLHALALMFLAVVIIMTVGRALNGQWSNAFADSFGGLLILMALWLSHNGRFRIASLLAAYGMTVLCFLLATTKLVPDAAILPQMALAMAIFIFVIETFWSRMIYIVCAISMLTIVCLQHHHFGMGLAFALQMAGCAFAFHCLVMFIEQQNRSLKSTVQSLQKSNTYSAEANKTLAEQNDQLLALSHIMSHDLKSPLAAISSSVELILDEDAEIDPEEKEEFLGYIAESANSMTRLINDILRFSNITRNGELDTEEVDLDVIFEEVVSMFRLDLVHQGAVVERADLPRINGHAETLGTVFQNLLSNAIKYQPLDEDHRPHIQIWSEETEDEARVFFADNGIGIDEKFQPHIFTPFRRDATADYKGTGLGMSICKSIVESHGGRIGLWSSSEAGTTFVVTFPRLEGSGKTRPVRYGRPEDTQPIDLDALEFTPEIRSAFAS